jgi:CheY-like chemotaxis protein
MMVSIIVIEDEPQSARLAQTLLKRGGFDVILAEDGEGGITSTLHHGPDLVLVDLGLPDMDGQTVVALLRQQPGMDDTPIVAFTAWPMDKATEMAEAYGCDGVISKPINTRTFADQVRAYLRA